MRSQLILSLLLLALSPRVAPCALSNRDLSVIVVAGDASPEAASAVKIVVEHAQARLGLAPEQITRPPLTHAALGEALAAARGEALIFIAHAHSLGDGLKAGAARLTLKEIADLLEGGRGRRRALLVIDRVAGPPLRIHGAPSLEILSLKGPAAAAWPPALDALLARGGPGQGRALVERLKGVKARRYGEDGPRLFLKDLRVRLTPKLKNVESFKAIGQLEGVLRESAGLGDQLVILSAGEADIGCEVMAGARRAKIRCVQGDAPILESRVELSAKGNPFAEISARLLEGYRPLAGGAAPAPQATSSAPPYLRWSALSLGGLALVMGGVYYSLALSDQATLEDADRDAQGRVTGITQVEAQRLASDVERQSQIGVVSMALGGLFVGGGLWLWAAEGQAPSATPSASGAPPVLGLRF
ncbi:hypothetical protein KKB55_14980 [Myxococcota bacterium]|nr:hypothetical protein [Myxococcota bacterium]MBU1899042.1 hypothetical protein [Myxococcota bacterium]